MALLLNIIGVLFTCGVTIGQNLTFSNPIIDTNSADPAVMKLDNFYYMTLSDNRETELTIYKSPILTNFRNAEKIIAHKCAEGFTDLWASEMHVIDGNLWIYFTMRGVSTDNGHRMYVLKGNNPKDPMAGWSDPIRLFPEEPDFGGIDGTFFKQGNGQNYYVWTSFAKIYIAPMITPDVIGGPKKILREPTTIWECTNGGCQAEGPYFIYNQNISYLVFSGSGSFDPSYCLGLMSIYSDLDPMVDGYWRSWLDPVFTSNEEESVLGPGHASFTVSPDETETWMVYHAHGNNSSPGRIARIEKIEWNEQDEGTPIFPRPSGYNKVQPVPSGQTITDYY